MASRRGGGGVQYRPLSTEDDRDEFDGGEDDDTVGGEEGRGRDLRFSYTPRKYARVPWKSIALAVFLLLLGTMLLVLAYFIHSGHMPGDSSQKNGLMFLGILAFLPGFYESRVAYYSWRGAPGYNFASIPDY